MPGLILVNSVHVNRPAINPFVETKDRGLGAVADGFKGSRTKMVDRIDRKHLIRAHLRGRGGDDCKDEGKYSKKKKNKDDLTAMFHRSRVFASGVCG